MVSQDEAGENPFFYNSLHYVFHQRHNRTYFQRCLILTQAPPNVQTILFSLDIRP